MACRNLAQCPALLEVLKRDPVVKIGPRRKIGEHMAAGEVGGGQQMWAANALHHFAEFLVARHLDQHSRWSIPAHPQERRIGGRVARLRTVRDLGSRCFGPHKGGHDQASQ